MADRTITRPEQVAHASLAGLVRAEVSGVMLILQQRGHPPAVTQLRPTPRAISALNKVSQSAAAEFVDLELIDYGPATSTADGQIMWIDSSGVPLLKAILDESADLAAMPIFDPREARLGDLSLAAIRVEARDISAVLVQPLRGNQVVAQSRRLGFVVRKGLIDIPPRGQILLFSRDIAAVLVGQFAFFTDRSGFQRLFGYLDELRQSALATFNAVTVDLRIDGFDQMAIAVTTSPAMLGKMASIQRKLDLYPQYRAALTMPNLVEFVGRHPECGVELVGEGKDAKLAFHSDPQRRFKILKLLDDDLLRSELTALEYQANSKSSPIASA